MLENKHNISLRSSGIKQKKKIVWVFLLFSIAILFLAFWYYKTQVLEGPLTINISDELKKQILIDAEVDNAKTLEELKNSDTDQDGLNDYQEKYQFNTSMFLADTDSDGYSDEEEVRTGNDPLCPTGQDCNLLRLITPNTKIAEVIDSIDLNGDLTLQEAAVAEFRKFLLDNGFAQSEVDALSDDDLLYIFSILNESEIGQANQEAETGPEEVRAFLLSQPDADEKAIEALSDEELLKIRDQLIQS